MNEKLQNAFEEVTRKLEFSTDLLIAASILITLSAVILLLATVI